MRNLHFRFLALLILLSMLLASCSGQSKEEMVEQGNSLIEQGNLRGAIVLYRSALEKDANYLEARRQLGDVYLRSGQFDQAEKEFQKIRLQQPSDHEVLLKLAEIFIQQGKPQQALLELDKYSEAAKDSPQSLVLYGLAHGTQGDLDSAEVFFRKALQLDPQYADALINLAKVALQRNDFSVARRHLQQVIVAEPENLSAYYLQGMVERRAGQPDAALAAYQKLLKVDPRQLQALTMSGQLQLDLGQLDAAEQTVAQLSKQFPNAPETSRLKGMLQFRQQDFAAAVTTLQGSLSQQGHLSTYFYLGLAQFAQGYFEQALVQFQKTLDLHPEFERGRLMVALTLFKQKRLDDAINEVRRVLQQNPDNAIAQNLLGSALLATGRYDAGMEALETATELNPGLVDAYIKKGVVHLAQGKQEQGEADLVNAVQAQPEQLNSRLLLVTLYLRQKNYTAAIEAIEQGLNGSPTDALLKNYQAAAYFAQKKPEQAIAALKQAKEITPDYLTPYFNLASYYASQRDYDQAEVEYQAILAREENNLKALAGLTSLYAVQGRDAEIERMIQRIAESGSEQGYLIASRYHLSKGQVDRAVELLDRGLAAYPSAAALLELKGRVQLSQKQFEAAETTFQTLAEVEPAQGYTLLTQLYLGTERPAKAEQLSKQLLQNHPDEDYPYLLAAGLALRDGAVAAAEKHLEEGLAQVNESVQLRLQLGAVQAGQGQLQAAEEQFTQALQKNPRSSAAYLALATTKEQLGDKGTALDLYRQAVRFNQRNVQALNNLAYLLTDNFGEAQEALQFALQAYRLNPGDPRIMDTLGFVLLQNQRLEEADQLLSKAHEMLPEIPTVALHLAAVKVAQQETEMARQLLNTVIEDGLPDEVEQARELLKKLR